MLGQARASRGVCPFLHPSIWGSRGTPPMNCRMTDRIWHLRSERPPEKTLPLGVFSPPLLHLTPFLEHQRTFPQRARQSLFLSPPLSRPATSLSSLACLWGTPRCPCSQAATLLVHPARDGVLEGDHRDRAVCHRKRGWGGRGRGRYYRGEGDSESLRRMLDKWGN